MKIIENKAILNCVIKLAEKKATGKPADIANKLNISVRSFYRVRDEIIDQGIPLRYSRVLESYVID